MAQGKRIARVAELIRTEIANLILNDLKDPRLGFVTVMGVEVTPDLREAKVSVSVMGSKKEKKATLIALEHAKGFMQFRINDVIRLKFTPKLSFKLDESLDHSIRINEVIKKIHEDEGTEELPLEIPDDV